MRKKEGDRCQDLTKGKRRMEKEEDGRKGRDKKRIERELREKLKRREEKRREERKETIDS